MLLHFWSNNSEFFMILKKKLSRFRYDFTKIMLRLLLLLVIDWEIFAWRLFSFWHQQFVSRLWKDCCVFIHFTLIDMQWFWILICLNFSLEVHSKYMYSAKCYFFFRQIKGEKFLNIQQSRSFDVKIPCNQAWQSDQRIRRKLGDQIL